MSYVYFAPVTLGFTLARMMSGRCFIRMPLTFRSGSFGALYFTVGG